MPIHPRATSALKHGEGIEFPGLTIYDAPGDMYYVPFVSDDGRVGYRVSTTDGSRETFIYMNPTTDSSGSPSPDVFVYEGIENDPAEDEPVAFIAPEALI
jgi:hypothetical protein